MTAIVSDLEYFFFTLPIRYGNPLIFIGFVLLFFCRRREFIQKKEFFKLRTKRELVSIVLAVELFKAKHWTSTTTTKTELWTWTFDYTVFSCSASFQGQKIKSVDCLCENWFGSFTLVLCRIWFSFEWLDWSVGVTRICFIECVRYVTHPLKILWTFFPGILTNKSTLLCDGLFRVFFGGYYQDFNTKFPVKKYFGAYYRNRNKSIDFGRVWMISSVTILHSIKHIKCERERETHE